MDFINLKIVYIKLLKVCIWTLIIVKQFAKIIIKVNYTYIYKIYRNDVSEEGEY